MVRDPETGKYRRTRLFVLTLGYSRKSVRLLVWRSSAQIWAELHERAFRRLGGTVRVIVLDNLKEGVLTPDIYDPALNPLYRDVLAHYGVVALPCRVGDPDRKGQGRSRRRPRAEDAAARACASRRSSEAQAYLDRWETHWADTRIHGTTKRQVAAMFAEERPALGPLPARAVSLLPLRRAHRPSRWLRRSRGRVLRRAARLDRPARPGAVERSARPPARSEDRAAAARASARAARLASASHDADRPARTPAIDASRCSRGRATAGAHIGTVCTSHPPARRRRRRPPHPRRPRPRQETRPGRRRRRRESGARARRADLSLPPPVSRTPAAGAADAAPGRSRSFGSSRSIAISSIAKQETRYESRRTRSRPPQTPPLRHGRRPRSPPPPRPDREAGAARSRRPRSSATNCCVGRTGSSRAGTSRRAFATPTARSTPLISISTRR